MNNFKRYVILWLSQSMSQLGSSMTAFALVLWTYEQTHSALSVSIMSFCNYLPYVLLSIAAGSFIDAHSKKAIMLVSDSAAAATSLVLLFLQQGQSLSTWHIYLINAVIGITTAFQQPASQIAAARLVPREKLSNVSGMNSFSNNLVLVFSPMLASVLFAAGGLSLILLIDLLSFAAAFCVLLFFIHIPEQVPAETAGSPLAGFKTGLHFVLEKRGLLYIMLTLALLNFFSRLTYENILSPMILARGNGDSMVLGTVNAFMGIGGIAGGLFVTFKKASKKNADMIYRAAALSFLCGDLLMAVGNNVYWWSLAAFAASFPIPFIMAGQNMILYRTVPENIQGRVFAVRNALQYSTIPIGILSGGLLADYVFEPFIASDTAPAVFLGKIVGNGAGSGMAAMFLCTGACGFLMSIAALFNREIRKLNFSTAAEEQS